MVCSVSCFELMLTHGVNYVVIMSFEEKSKNGEEEVGRGSFCKNLRKYDHLKKKWNLWYFIRERSAGSYLPINTLARILDECDFVGSVANFWPIKFNAYIFAQHPQHIYSIDFSNPSLILYYDLNPLILLFLIIFSCLCIFSPQSSNHISSRHVPLVHDNIQCQINYLNSLPSFFMLCNSFCIEDRCNEQQPQKTNQQRSPLAEQVSHHGSNHAQDFSRCHRLAFSTTDCCLLSPESQMNYAQSFTKLLYLHNLNSFIIRVTRYILDLHILSAILPQAPFVFTMMDGHDGWVLAESKSRQVDE